MEKSRKILHAYVKSADDRFFYHCDINADCITTMSYKKKLGHFRVDIEGADLWVKEEDIRKVFEIIG